MTRPELARRIYRVGQLRQDLGGREPVENYPYALTMMTITRMVIEALRLGSINGACEKYDSVEAAADLLFTAAANELVSEYEEKGLCVDDFNEVTGALRARCINDPKGLIKSLRQTGLWEPVRRPIDLEVALALQSKDYRDESSSPGGD